MITKLKKPIIENTHKTRGTNQLTCQNGESKYK